MFPSKFPHRDCGLRVIAAFLALSLILPSPVFALRQLNAGMEESPVRNQLDQKLTTGLEERFLINRSDDASALAEHMVRVVSGFKRLRTEKGSSTVLQAAATILDVRRSDGQGPFKSSDFVHRVLRLPKDRKNSLFLTSKNLQTLAATLNYRSGPTRRQALVLGGLVGGSVYLGYNLVQRASKERQPPPVQLVQSHALDEYFENLQGLSTSSWDYANWVNVFPTDEISRVYLRTKNRGGTVVGVSFQHQFSFAVLAKPSTYVIYDINPFVTEVMVPFFGQIMEQAGSRREFLSILLGVELTDEDVHRLLEPKKREGTSLNDYLVAELHVITERVPLDRRQHWYREQILKLLYEGVVPHLQAIGRLKDAEQLKKVGKGFPMEMFEYFLRPDLLFTPPKEESTPTGVVITRWKKGGGFVSFLEDHAQVSWFGLPWQTWLSTEENYKLLREYWKKGVFVGMTADFTDQASIQKLGRWLRDQNKEPISIVYPSNVAEFVGPEESRKMYNALGALPLRKDALVLVSHSPSLVLGEWSYGKVKSFYEYVRPQEDVVVRYLFGINQRFLKGSFYEALLSSLTYYYTRSESFVRGSEGRPREEGLTDDKELAAIRLEPFSGQEVFTYQRLIAQIQKSEREIQHFSPQQFTEWVGKKEPQLSTETDYFRAFVWNLVDGGIISPWPNGFKWGEKPLPQLITEQTDALKSSHPHVRRTAALILGKLGPKAKEAIPALEKALGDEGIYSGVQKAMKDALSQIRTESKAGLEEQEIPRRGFLGAVAALGTAPITRIMGMFVEGNPNRPVDDALGARVNVEQGQKETYVVDLNAAAQIDPAALPVMDRILVHPGALIPSAWRNAALVTVPKDLGAAKEFLDENAHKGDIFLVADDAEGSVESWGNLFIRYGVLGIRTTESVVTTINHLTNSELVALLASLGSKGGLILGAEIQSRTPGERNLLVSA